MGLAAGPVVPTREWRELYAALIARWSPRSIRSIPPRCASSQPPDVRRRVPHRSGYEGTAAWLDAVGEAAGSRADKIGAAQNRILPAIRAALAKSPISGRITLSGYEGSELLVARLLIESGADVRYVGTACPRHRMVGRRPRMARGQGRASCSFAPRLQQDLAALQEFEPDLAIGTTPVVQKAKELGDSGALLHQSRSRRGR